MGHVEAIREANSEERQDEIQYASESNAKEDNKSYHKGEKTSESGVHTVEVWCDDSKKENLEKKFERTLQEFSPIGRVFGCFSLREEMSIGFCAQKTATEVVEWKKCNKRANVVDWHVCSSRRLTAFVGQVRVMPRFPPLICVA